MWYVSDLYEHIIFCEKALFGYCNSVLVPINVQHANVVVSLKFKDDHTKFISLKQCRASSKQIFMHNLLHNFHNC